MFKASLVLLFFMHLKYDKPFNAIVITHLAGVRRAVHRERDDRRRPQYRAATGFRAYAPSIKTNPSVTRRSAAGLARRTRPGAGGLRDVGLLAALAVLFAAAIVCVPRRAPPGAERWPAARHAAPPARASGSRRSSLAQRASTVHLAHRAIRSGELAARGAQATAARSCFRVWLPRGAAHGLAGADPAHTRPPRRTSTPSHSSCSPACIAAHVVGGIGLLAVVWSRARRLRYGRGHHPGITYAAMYVHFPGCGLAGAVPG